MNPIFLLRVPLPEIKSQAGADDKSIRIQILHPVVTVIQEIIANIGIENEVGIQGKIYSASQMQARSKPGAAA